MTGPLPGESFNAYCEQLKAECRAMIAARQGVGRFIERSVPRESPAYSIDGCGGAERGKHVDIKA